MTAATKNLTIEQRATFHLRLTWKDTKGKAVNLTGYTARLQARINATDPTAAIDASTANGKITLSAAGVIEVVLSATETAALTFTSAVYDLKLTSGTGESTRLLQGQIKLSVGVTQ